MSIAPGSHVGPYEVTSQLGEGGMGVVFRGHDARLQRDVALKVLPDHFASDPDRLSRFQREAQLLASLNHANIAQIYGLEHVEGTTCIVMELVEGETLADRLTKGPLSSDEALDIARQIADALAAAHERGIVHRDLKPANIKLTPNGTVKVLDFGLAKALGAKASDTQVTYMPTMATGSIVGSIVGTPGYMSPEQARGKEVDARTDIWAFGCVLYEMLTARQAFAGETVTDVMAKIVTSPPDLNLLPKETSPAVRSLLAATLNKNSAQRLQHIGDTRLFLDGTLVPAATAVANSEDAGRRGKLVMAALAVALAALALLAVPAYLYFRAAPAASHLMRFELTVPGIIGQPDISPNGTLIAYIVQPTDGKRALWVRPVDSEVGERLAGTEDANGFFWSPDSKRIAFLSDGKLKWVDVEGRLTQVLGEVGQIRGGDWGTSGVILVARISDNVISSISENGGALTPVTKLDAGRGEALHGLPAFLPDGKHFVYIAAGSQIEQSNLLVGSLNATEAPTLLAPVRPANFNGIAYVSGHLLILNNGRITAQQLDERGRALEGDAVVVAEDLQGGFSISNNGLLLYRKAVQQTVRQLLWFDRNGRQTGQVGAPGIYGNVDISPKGDRAAVDLTTDNNRDIWVIDLERSVPARVTFDRAPDWTASWSSDGTRLVFASTRNTNNVTRIHEKSAAGAGEETELPTDHDAIPVHLSPDNKYVVYSRNRGNAVYDTWLLPTFGERKAIPFLESPFDKMQARVSPDGHFVAYATNESGAYQVVVQTFPDPSGGKWTISAEGGTEPKWRHDGRELYYLAFDGKMMSVSINTSPAFKAGRPEVLFQTPLTVNRAQPLRDRRYDVAPNGRFLMVTPAATAITVPVTVVVNWDAALKK